MTIMMRFQNSFIMCLLLMGVLWTDSARGDAALAEDVHKSVSKGCTKDQYYDEHLEKCSPCKEVCPTIPCPVCPNFVLNPEPVPETKPEQHDTVDHARGAFWIVLGILIFFMVCIAGSIIVCLRHRWISLCKKKTRPRVVEAAMETQQPLCGQNSTLVV
ncbi:hypothetical protein ACJMK2_009738 [Sinanodonta woodiana]|uniref:Uncharacterized protein n=1 Tax=Sinanodonta woodiana TaxID=1069815 RepID=A0ABD3VG58_SINWO